MVTVVEETIAQTNAENNANIADAVDTHRRSPVPLPRNSSNPQLLAQEKNLSSKENYVTCLMLLFYTNILNLLHQSDEYFNLSIHPTQCYYLRLQISTIKEL